MSLTIEVEPSVVVEETEIDLNNNANGKIDEKSENFLKSESETHQESDNQTSECKIFGFPFSKIKWFNVFWLLICHILAITGYLVGIITGVKVFTLIWAITIGVCSGLGMIVGAHRLWSHKAFKARWPLRLLLMIFQTMAVFNTAFHYARDHRQHHKYSDTELDPKNPARGFFYSHMGNWMLKKTPEVIAAGQKYKVQDLYDDWVLTFQRKYYKLLVLIFWLIIPAAVPYFLWHETIWNSILLCVFTRYVVFLHHFLTVNSITHGHLLKGSRDYDLNMRPTENRLVNYLSLGSGHHNYHHTFPYDYSESERGWLFGFNPGTLFIDACAALNLAYDLKKPSQEMVKQRVIRTGTPKEDKSKVLGVIEGILDWMGGLFFTSLSLLLAVVLRIAYVSATDDLTVDKIVQW